MELLLPPLLRLRRALRKRPKAPARMVQNGTVEWPQNYLPRGQLTGDVVWQMTC
jgi:hypothetical protein